MRRCQNCGTDNLDTARYCDECGAELIVEIASGHSSPPSPGDSTTDAIPRPQKPLASARWERPAERGAPTSSPRARLRVARGTSTGYEFPLKGTEWLIGRWDPERGIFPDVDLDPVDPEATVSRRHARIWYQNGHYLIEDLGSTNGTFINRGRRLTPGMRYVIRNGDEIIVGKTFLKFIVE